MPGRALNNLQRPFDRGTYMVHVLLQILETPQGQGALSLTAQTPAEASAQ